MHFFQRLILFFLVAFKGRYRGEVCYKIDPGHRHDGFPTLFEVFPVTADQAPGAIISSGSFGLILLFGFITSLVPFSKMIEFKKDCR